MGPTTAHLLSKHEHLTYHPYLDWNISVGFLSLAARCVGLAG